MEFFEESVSNTMANTAIPGESSISLSTMVSGVLTGLIFLANSLMIGKWPTL
jgi:hypothetical protein